MAKEVPGEVRRWAARDSICAVMSRPITGEISAHVGPDLRGVLLGLVEVYQRGKRWQGAISCVERLR